MKLEAVKFGCAVGCAFAVVWVICSALVAFLPGGMLSMSGSMMHADLSEGMHWALTWPGFFFGLLAWFVTAAFTGWLIAVFYNWSIKS